MEGLLEPYIPNFSDFSSAATRGYALGDMMRNRDLNVSAGGLLSKGDVKGARDALYAGGNLDEGGKLDAQLRAQAREAKTEQLEKATKFQSMLGNLAMAADTPEKWGQAIGVAQKMGLDVGKYADFGARDLVLAQSGKTADVLKMELERRKADIMEGKADAIAARAAMPKPRVLTDKSIEKLGAQGASVENVNRYITTFKDENAGYGKGGDTAMWLGRNMPIFTGPTTENAAGWWNDYDRYKNVVRNELFGSALTPSEQEAFEKADIGPNMSPALIRENLKRQQGAVKSALRKHTNALKKSGYSEEAVDAATGLTAEQLAEEQASGGSGEQARINLDRGTQQTAPARGGGESVPPEAVKMLRGNPSSEMRNYFDETFGPGAAQRALGQ
jgi:hypothetical protein